MKMPEYLEKYVSPLPPKPVQEFITVAQFIEYLKTVPQDLRIATYLPLGDNQDEPTVLSLKWFREIADEEDKEKEKGLFII